MQTSPDSFSPLAYAMADAARLLSVSERTVTRMIATGRLRAISLGRRRLVPRDALEELLASRDGIAPGGLATSAPTCTVRTNPAPIDVDTVQEPNDRRTPLSALIAQVRDAKA